MEQIIGILKDEFSTAEALSPLYLLCFTLLGLLIYLIRREEGSFIAFLLPKAIWTHASTRSDIWLLLMGRLMGILGLTTRFIAGPAVAAYVATLMPAPVLSGAVLTPLLLAFLLFVIGDLGLYWVHRLHHQIKALWPLHAVHHSAAVLTPLTAFRQHPLALLVSASINTIIFGVLFGVLLGAFNPEMTYTEIVGANAFLVLANMTITNFQHSHIWIDFGPLVGRIIISPAQHQIHHSTDIKHYNKNFGQTFAVWDWIFGTLYLIREKEVITFGLRDKIDAPLMTQRLGPILIDPLRRMLRPPH